MLSEAELACVAAARGEGVRLVVHAGADAELGLALADTARQLADAGVGVAADHGDGSGLVATPALVVVTDVRANAVWSVAPDGPEAGPFAEHVAALLAGESPPAWTAPLAELAEPAELLVFVASSCPHCPNAVRLALAAARATDAVRVTVVDVQRHEELARRFVVSAVPLTLLDRGLAITGVAEPRALAATICERGSEQHGEQLFASLLEGGRLDEAALAAREDPRRFVTAWLQSSTSTRMGLMLVAEKMLEADGTCLDGAVALLIPAARAEDAALRGDTADLLGQIGHPDCRVALEQLLEDDNPDVVEIAGDALGMLRQ